MLYRRQFWDTGFRMFDQQSNQLKHYEQRSTLTLTRFNVASLHILVR